MTQQRKSETTDPAYRYLHLSWEKLSQLPPDDLLQACLELRRLLEIIRGILYTPIRRSSYVR